MKKSTVVIIGGGNMGRAFAEGLSKNKSYKIVVSSPNTKKLKSLPKASIEYTKDNIKAAQNADILILAVKPQIMPSVLDEIKGKLKPEALVISIAAGISLKKLSILGPLAVVRAMPNLCAQVGESMTAWHKNAKVSSKQKTIVKQILKSIGSECELSKEKDIDSATAIAGSGPAYLFYLAECMTKEAEKLGLSKSVAKMLAEKTITGSAKVIKTSKSSALELRSSVTSKGGTTEAAFKEFEKMKLNQVLSKGIQAAAKKANELGKIKR